MWQNVTVILFESRIVSGRENDKLWNQNKLKKTLKVCIDVHVRLEFRRNVLISQQRFYVSLGQGRNLLDLHTKHEPS